MLCLTETVYTYIRCLGDSRMSARREEKTTLAVKCSASVLPFGNRTEVQSDQNLVGELAAVVELGS